MVANLPESLWLQRNFYSGKRNRSWRKKKKIPSTYQYRETRFCLGQNKLRMINLKPSLSSDNSPRLSDSKDRDKDMKLDISKSWCSRVVILNLPDVATL